MEKISGDTRKRECAQGRQQAPRIILDLCGGTGSWSEPYRAAGYDVRLVTLPDGDVRTYAPPSDVHGILAAPPCTEFSSSGARWWAGKPPLLLEDAIAVARAVLRIIADAKPQWYAIENPVGRIAACVPELGTPAFRFDPCDFGDPWTKRTYLWGKFTPPLPLFSPQACRATKPTANIGGSSPIHRMSPGPDRQRMRSQTPPGFAQAFFEANQ